MQQIKRITKKFVPREHPEHGTWGWLEVGSPDTYFPLEAMGVAHDVLEHKLRPKQGIEEELMAFGAMLFIRYDGGYWVDRRGSASEWYYQVSTDLAEMMVKYGDAVKPCRSRILSGELEFQRSMGIDHANREAFDMDYTFRGLKYETRENLLGWIRKGYRWAVNRYGDAFRVCCWFQQIQVLVARLDAESCYENGEMLVISIINSTVKVRTQYGP